jgi:hypothetical protein
MIHRKWSLLKMPLEIDRHMDEEEVERYSLGGISEPDSSRLDEHLLICEFCQSRVAESDRYVSTMQFAAAQMRRDTRRSKTRWAGFSGFAALAAAAVILYLAIGGPGLAKRAAAPQPAFLLNLIATRGNGIEAKAPAGTTLNLQMELAGLRNEPWFRLEIVDGLGKRVWQGNVVPQDSKAAASVPKMAGGVYFVRAYAPSGDLLREYGLEVEDR